MMTMLPDEFAEWLETRPPVVQQIGRQFPPGASVLLNARRLWVISYTEEGMLGLTPIDPSEDYDAALDAERVFICAKHLPPSIRTPT